MDVTIFMWHVSNTLLCILMLGVMAYVSDKMVLLLFGGGLPKSERIALTFLLMAFIPFLFVVVSAMVILAYSISSELLGWILC